MVSQAGFEPATFPLGGDRILKTKNDRYRHIRDNSLFYEFF